VVWGGRMERSLVGGFRVVNGCLPNLLSRQNRKQPEREINDKFSKIQKFEK